MLTKKKRLYSEARENGQAIGEAAIYAGYSEKSCSQAGSRLEKDPDVITFRARIRAKGMPDEVPPSHDIECGDDPKEFLAKIMKSQGEDMRMRVDCAKTLMPYVYGKVADQGKKDDKKKKADEAAKKFSPRTRSVPRLVK